MKSNKKENNTEELTFKKFRIAEIKTLKHLMGGSRGDFNPINLGKGNPTQGTTTATV